VIALKRSRLLQAGALLTLIALAGCGKDNSQEVTGPATTSASTSGSTESGASAASAPPVQQQQQQQANAMAEAMRQRGQQGNK